MDHKPLPHIEIEPAFDRIVELAQGRRIDELVGKNPVFDNADYYFESDGIIAELKVLEKDSANDNNTRDKVQRMYLKWVKDGRMPPPQMPGKIRIELLSLPEDLRHEFIKPFRNVLLGPIK